MTQTPTALRRTDALLRVERWGTFEVPIYQIDYDGVTAEVPQHISRFTTEKYSNNTDGWYIRFERMYPGPFRLFISDSEYDGDMLASLEAAKEILQMFLEDCENVWATKPRCDQETNRKYIRSGVSGLGVGWRIRSFRQRIKNGKPYAIKPDIYLTVGFYHSKLLPSKHRQHTRVIPLKKVSPESVYEMLCKMHGYMMEEARLIEKTHGIRAVPVLEGQKPRKPSVKELTKSLTDFLIRNDEHHHKYFTYNEDLTVIPEGPRSMITSMPLYWISQYINGTQYRTPSTITPTPGREWSIDEPLLTGARYVDSVPFGNNPGEALNTAVSYLLSARAYDAVNVVKRNSKE